VRGGIGGRVFCAYNFKMIVVSSSIDELLAHRNGSVRSNWSAARLAEAALQRNEGTLADNGALVVKTGAFTGRSPQDKYVVRDATTEGDVWWGSVNHPVSPAVFDQLLDKALAHLAKRELYVFDGYAGAAESERLGLRVITEKAWHALFATTLFIRPSNGELAHHHADFTLINAGSLPAGGAALGLRSDVFVGIDFNRRIALILGTEYAGEMKKAIFSVMNYLLPRKGILTMHCSANIAPGAAGAGGSNSALFFGLSGTGKTTLSADPARALIGDDETAWSDGGIFNIEGGCYAKCINLSRETEPQIHDAIRFGSVLENVVVDPATRRIDYASAAITENTRATYPVEFIPGAAHPSVGPHPRTVVFLTADAFGVLPPIARLTPALAMYHYISGYTAKVAGTEAGVTEPKATFSPCFGGPFLPLHPMRYAKLLGDRLSHHGASCWLVNTGWSGGPYGVGSRMKIGVSRAVVAAALSGALDAVRFSPDPVFKVDVPEECPGVPRELLKPRQTWPDREAYDVKARELAALFKKNFEQYAAECSPEVRAAGPE
jgi:phosphoenolpyruvate carboxykinase (ATP)